MDAPIVHPSLACRVTHGAFKNKMWLIAGGEVDSALGNFHVRGHIEESFLGLQPQWKHLSAAQRNAREAECLVKAAPALQDAMDGALCAVVEFLAVCEHERLSPNIRKLRDAWASGELNLWKLPGSLEQSMNDMRAAQRQRELATQIGQNVKLADYPDTFLARVRPRRLIAVLGPTNSGKSFAGFQRLAQAASGMYLGPLRLLALEAFTRLNEEFGVPTSLVTGEERRIVDGSRVTASTIEMLDAHRAVDVCVIDEIQMLSDPDRGWAWTQAVVGANASEVWLLGALSAEPAIKALAQRLGLPLEVRKTERKHPLVVGAPLAPHPTQAIRKAQAGDAFIVFSRRDALNLRDDLLAQGRSVACVYGALSPEVRENESRRFACGEAEVLVATDAIGLGLNLGPLRRVVFTSVQKFDGESRDDLPVALLQQIGGRAGRFGHEHVEPGVVCGLTPAEHEVVEHHMAATQPTLPRSGFQITPGTAYLEQIADMSGDDRLEALLSLFLLHADSGDGFFTAHVPDEQLARAGHLDRLSGLSLPLKHVFSMAPMSSREEEMDAAWSDWAYKAHKGVPVALDFIPKSPEMSSLAEAETIVRLLAAYRWFGYRLPEIFVDYDQAEVLLAPWVAMVDSHLKSKYKQGNGGGKRGLPSWYWTYKPAYQH